jgi:hypothetical protein
MSRIVHEENPTAKRETSFDHTAKRDKTWPWHVGQPNANNREIKIAVGLPIK